ncbi:16S rRNA (uracil(1498)-N(3))-methyltransferase [Flavobacteriaceae bacterium]|nr:16S rRNA (uracil(1498)-N(3))-methyltransferase [Flavobacteriaceae bacterium]MDA7797584.1 16S rRNA (uracil(1498)-N(3))-methyltransferase [Flavobacteriaceae bacterium]MDA8948713.1 16S rRNA (uracil(1498)-N(3))-methyltransferase [Flavobacteriaceae bacterium]MDA9015746.1 16S rRNA (uracil(1498)-N(3))-methyltransferase [Flavobacteriaceae bacterium]MDB3862009.1 16S rRNA (uracil(1498)-N(3))-methyltransferase [Flavobacteriaceae bacterium]
MSLFFDTTLKNELKEFSFSKEESKHLAKVLRKKTGDQISITNGNGLEWQGELIHVSQSVTIAKKIKATQHNPPSKLIHLAIAPTKNNNRMEWLIEKLTELGIASITPLVCDHSERKIDKALRFEKIAIAALKQSQQFYLPKINKLCAFSNFVAEATKTGYIAHCGSNPKKNLASYDLDEEEVTLLIGPEGDFSPLEIEEAEKSGFISVSIGNQRFRTETAGLLACHTVFLQQQKN